ncbi:glycosyl transferase family 1 [Candidatus Omnitrophus magneticus]|uniref:Glycosyl transferase family 1 n=1 Tax=Candidatus Omnitrophus magneticus TaxID=1609969 RepID=A0A0F0CNG8_9BACT|nr:glycosyl transferase family 1 [Candidatus Omnitrophus magneticus]
MKICFVVEDIYPALTDGRVKGNMNGRAIHLKHLGEALLKLGHDVSYITKDYGQNTRENINNFCVYKMYSEKEGLPGLKFFMVKVPKLLKAFSSVDAELYIFMCPSPFVGIIAWFCAKKNKKFIYYGGSDMDFNGNGWKINARDYFLFKYGLKKANMVLCQNKYQAETLLKFYNIKGNILHNPMPKAMYSYNPKSYAIWVANYRALKRPEIFIELARRVKIKFMMVGGRTSACAIKEFENIKMNALNAGIDVKGALDFKKTDELIAGSSLLVNTSEFEGISNTFLQAWRRGIPVVSFVDPDGMIEKEHLGKTVKNIDELVIAVKEISKGIEKEKSLNIKKFFDTTFSSDAICEKFSNYLKQI